MLNLLLPEWGGGCVAGELHDCLHTLLAVGGVMDRDGEHGAVFLADKTRDIRTDDKVFRGYYRRVDNGMAHGTVVDEAEQSPRCHGLWHTE